MPVIVEATFEAALPIAPSMELMPSISDWMRFIPNCTICPARLLKKPPMLAPRLVRMPEMRPHTALNTATTLSQADCANPLSLSQITPSPETNLSNSLLPQLISGLTTLITASRTPFQAEVASPFSLSQITPRPETNLSHSFLAQVTTALTTLITASRTPFQALVASPFREAHSPPRKLTTFVHAPCNQVMTACTTLRMVSTNCLK